MSAAGQKGGPGPAPLQALWAQPAFYKKGIKS